MIKQRINSVRIRSGVGTPRLPALLLAAAALVIAALPHQLIEARGAGLPDQPTGLSATATSTTITLSWGAVSGATGYDVKQGSGGTVTAVSSGTSHTFSGLTAGTEYTLYVRAGNSGRVSDWTSTTATAVLAAPSNLSASVSVDQYRVVKSLSLSWDSVAGATAYEVKLGENRAAITVLATEYRFSYQDYGSDALLDTVYVRAKNSDGFSAWQSARA